MRLIGILLLLSSPHIIACDEEFIKPELRHNCEPEHNIYVSPTKVEIQEIKGKLSLPSTPISVNAKIVNEPNWINFQSIISLVAIFLSGYSIYYTRQTYFNTLKKSIHDDHWYRNVVHPTCFEPCLEFITWASSEIQDSIDNNKVDEFELEYEKKQQKVIKSLRLLYISHATENSAITTMETILFELSDRVTGEIYNLAPEQIGGSYKTGDFYFEFAMTDIAGEFKKLHGDIASIN